MMRRSDLASTRWSWLAGGVLIGLAGVCWALSAVRMNGMDTGPGGDLGAAAWFIPTWLVMMAAMMLPVMAVVVRRDAGGAERAVVGRAAATATFIAGYLTVWGVVGPLVYELLSVARSVSGEAFVWNRAGRWLAAALLASAAAYQLTGPKRRALARCRHSSRSRPPGLAGLRRASTV
jgi:predicted metal-binding membrane protein